MLQQQSIVWPRQEGFLCQDVPAHSILQNWQDSYSRHRAPREHSQPPATTNDMISAKPHNQEPVTALSISLHPHCPHLEGLHILLSDFPHQSLTKTLSAPAALSVHRIVFLLSLQHQHNPRGLQSQSLQQVGNSAHGLFLSV